MIKVKVRAQKPTTVYLTLATYSVQKQDFVKEVQALCLDNVLGQWVVLRIEETDLDALKASSLEVKVL